MFGLLSAAARSRQKKKATYSDHILRHHTRIKIQKNKTENFGSKAQRRRQSCRTQQWYFVWVEETGVEAVLELALGCGNKGCQVVLLSVMC